jgi:hypothetical protein
VIHQVCSEQLQASHRRKVSSAIVSGAAASHALSGKTRSRVHDQSNAPQPAPEVLCNKNRSGTCQVKAPVAGVPVGSSLPSGGTRGSETADFGGQSRSCRDGLGSRCSWLTHAQVGSVRGKLVGWIRSGKSPGTGL